MAFQRSISSRMENLCQARPSPEKKLMFKFCISGIILSTALFNSVVSASSFSAGDQEYRPLKPCTDLEELNASKIEGPLVFDFYDDEEIICRLTAWSDKSCKKGEWVYAQSATMAVADITHDYDYHENSLQFVNPNEWPITKIDFEYKKLKGDIIYELKLENLRIESRERVLITNLPNEYRFYHIENVRVFGEKKPVCIDYFSEEEIAERQQKEAALLEQQRHKEQTTKKQIEELDSEEMQEKIFTNCIEDKMPPNPDQTYKMSIMSICQRASESPTLWNRIWYDYLGQ